ncbi:DUF11 domain-containing protein [Deinococcus aerophilus]|uniref:DUF11 domain-containing protein n=1 Tax=Deinococcus aerophilus TaxID=522488 RepID=A0ABQ2GZA3_9DEIO|nr:DUF11 domain-containing protein [Deinococcus aerophilus]
MAAGTAGAAGTPAGTVITNTATATYTDPTTNATVLEPAKSNSVSTLVLEKPDFDIVYFTGAADGTTATGALPTGYQSQKLPGDTLETPYKVLNSGNVNNYVVTLAANTAGSPSAPESVLYYLDANNDGILDVTERNAGPITKVTIPVDDLNTTKDEGVVSIIQVIKTPNGAAAGTQYAASPQGTAAVYSGNTVIQKTEDSTDLQYSRVLIYTPSIVNDVIDSDPNTPGRQDPPTTVTPPGQSSSVPGYADPTRPGTNIVTISPDNQMAYPKADVDSTDDTVAFVNSLTNGGSLQDIIRLFPTNTTGAGGAASVMPSVSGVFTLPGGITVRFTDVAGVALPVDGSGYPLLTVDAGKTVGYRTVVTYPDYDSDPTRNPGPIVIIVGADSGNDADLLAEDTSIDTIYPSQLQFGDATVDLGTSPTPAPLQSVVPGAAAGTATGVSTDSSAVFPMDLTNLGAYTDVYTLVGTVVVPVINPDTTVTSQIVNVRYFNNNNNQPGTELPFVTNGNGTRTYTTPAVLADAELKVFAVIDMPANAQATTFNGVTNTLKVNQRATAVYSTIVREDNNDEIAVAQPGNKGVEMLKTEPSAARPGEMLSYTITAKNNYNAGLKKFYVTESNSNPGTNIFTWTTFDAVTATKNFTDGTVMYRFNGGAWQSTKVPAIAANMVTSVDVGVDTNNNGTVDDNDIFPAQGNLTVIFQVVIK